MVIKHAHPHTPSTTAQTHTRARARSRGSLERLASRLLHGFPLRQELPQLRRLRVLPLHQAKDAIAALSKRHGAEALALAKRQDAESAELGQLLSKREAVEQAARKAFERAA